MSFALYLSCHLSKILSQLVRARLLSVDCWNLPPLCFHLTNCRHLLVCLSMAILSFPSLIPHHPHYRHHRPSPPPRSSPVAKQLPLKHVFITTFCWLLLLASFLIAEFLLAVSSLPLVARKYNKTAYVACSFVSSPIISSLSTSTEVVINKKC